MNENDVATRKNTHSSTPEVAMREFNKLRTRSPILIMGVLGVLMIGARALLLLAQQQIETSASLAVADDKTTRPLMKLNSDFYLPEMRNITDPNKLNWKRRVKWMMRRYRNGATFGLLENKLLSSALLSEWGVPILRTLHGAFATKAMGTYPMYDRETFIAAMGGIREVARDHTFVLKPATDGGSANVLIMNPEKWRSEKWTFEKLADFTEQFLLKDGSNWVSEWGQRFEHRGVIVQESLASRGTVPSHPSFEKLASTDVSTKTAAMSDFIELRIHIVFGNLACAQFTLVPMKHFTKHSPLITVRFGSLSEGGAPECQQFKNINADPATLCATVGTMISTHIQAISSIAAKIRDAYAADWFRLDVFLNGDGTILINEVTYPSHLPPDCSIDQLVLAYQHSSFDLVDSSAVLHPLLRLIRVDPHQFEHTADYESMVHADEGTYDGLKWKWRPRNRKAAYQPQKE